MREQNERANPSQPYTPETPTVVLSPSAELPPLGPEELAVLRQVGQEWASRLRRPQPRLDALPLDPTLGRRPGPPAPSRFGRFAPVDMFQAEQPDQLVASGAPEPTNRLGRVARATRRVLLGPPLSSAAVVQERMRKLVALPILSSDLLSSVAYGPEAMMAILVLAGSAALSTSLPLAAVLVVMVLTVGASYRQTVKAYPHGAGSYIVACDNLGRLPGLMAGVSLLTDYVLTVSVSVSAGVQAVTSAIPALDTFRVEIGILVIAILLVGNLRGVRAAGNIFAAPTYAFLLAIGLVIGLGLIRAAGRGFAVVPPPPVPALESLGLLLVLRAFSSGATSMTGIEAVSNAVPAFRPLEWRNARTSLTWMVGLLAASFAGLIVMYHLAGIAPRPQETMLSQLARQTVPGPLYGYVQVTTALILLLAANTAFNDLPRLLFFMARDCNAPRSFLHMGDRLAFSNGIIALAVTAGVLFVAFGGRTQSLIPLYAVGVFLAFTLSQAGMVVHWRRHKGRRWRWRLGINAAGAVLSAVVLVVAAIGKFVEGAWVVVLSVPGLVLLSLRIRRHYDAAARALALHPAAQPSPSGTAGPAGPAEAPGPQGQQSAPPGPAPPGPAPPPSPPTPPAPPSQPDGAGPAAADSPQEVGHLVVVPLARLDLAALRALAYAASLGQPMFAVHISPDEDEDDRFRQQWETWGNHVRLEIIVSPYRTIAAPLISYLRALHALRPDITLTVVVPELVVQRRWHRLLHSNTPRRLREALRYLPGVVVTSVPVQIPA